MLPATLKEAPSPVNRLDARKPEFASGSRFRKVLASRRFEDYNTAIDSGVGMSGSLTKKLEEEVRSLERELNHELPAELKKAIAHGDLSENAEYIAARQRQDYVRARLAQLSKRLSEIALINLNNIPRDRVAFGSTVLLYDVTKASEVEYKIVASEEADVSQGMISTSSPIGRGLLGKQVGDLVTVQTPSGRKEFEILKLSTIHDEA